MNTNNQLLPKSIIHLMRSEIKLIDINEGMKESEKCAKYSLNIVLENVLRAVYRKELEQGFNDNVIERFVRRASGFTEIFGRVDELGPLQHSKKPLLLSLNETEPVR